MLSKKMVIIVSLGLLFFFNVIALLIAGRHYYSPQVSSNGSFHGPGHYFISIIAPVQKGLARTICFAEKLWTHYFYLVSITEENKELKIALSKAVEKNSECLETELSNQRFKTFLNFQKATANDTIAAQVIGKDPSPWFKSVIIDKGFFDGIRKGLPVVIPEGAVGQTIEVTKHYSKVLLLIDRNSAVDSIAQRTRARGIIRGSSDGRFFFQYVLKKYEIQEGDTVISSGLDGVYPKGLRVGQVQSITQNNSGIFQEVVVLPFVDFEKLEEVMIVLPSQKENDSGF
jgi:rod shape-determining protein MreC